MKRFSHPPDQNYDPEYVEISLYDGKSIGTMPGESGRYGHFLHLFLDGHCAEMSREEVESLVLHLSGICANWPTKEN